MTEEREQSVTLQNREKITVTGVSDVDRFDESGVVLYTTLGILTVKGSDLHINRLNVESGDLCIEGEIDALSYAQGEPGERKAGFFSRLLR